MSLRCSKLIYFITGDRAVSHWAAKDATLSLQGRRSEPRAAWDTIKAAPDSGWLITFPADITALTAAPASSWGRGGALLDTDYVTAKVTYGVGRLGLASAYAAPWPGGGGLWRGGSNDDDKLVCVQTNFMGRFYPPQLSHNPNSISSFTNEATWIGVILSGIII